MALTEGTDNLTGTDGDDVFSAPLEDGVVQTWNATDVLNGGEGTDRLNAVINTATTDFSTTPGSISNIEQVFIRAVEDATVDLTDSNSGITELWNDRSVENLTVEGLDGNATLGVVGGNGSNYSVEYANRLTDDTLNVALDRANTDDLEVLLDAVDGDSDTRLVKNLNVTLVGGSNIVQTLTGDFAIETLVVAGEGSFTLGEALVDVYDVDTTGVSGVVNLNLSGSDAAEDDLVVAMGDGNNIVTMAQADFITGGDTANFDSINLGGGTNLLNLTGVASDAVTADFEEVLDQVEGLNILGLTDGYFFVGDQDALANDVTLTLGDDGEENVTFTEAVSGNGELTIVAQSFGTEDQGDVKITNEAAFDGAISFVRAEDVTIVAEDSFTATLSGRLESLALNQEGARGDNFDITLTDTARLNAIDLSEITAGSITIDASAAGFDFTAAQSSTVDPSATPANEGEAAVVVTFNTDADVEYTAASNFREVFTFTEDFDADYVINGFETGGTAIRDRIDFDGLITGLEDLVFTEESGNLVITAADGQFDGSITLVGVTNESAVEAGIRFDDQA